MTMTSRTALRFLILGLVLLVISGCAPKPDRSLVSYGSSDPLVDAIALASTLKGTTVGTVGYTGSMEPLITGGDAFVLDPTYPYKDLHPGDVCIYKPTPEQAAYYPTLPPGASIIHMLADWSGDEAIMDGIANQHYEKGLLRMNSRTYRGRVVKVFTRRAK